ncbi:uncharacterized protein L203_101372 [Cryptococcus depauperatus CBS 7841]|uniref:Uncharacterized protein n=1 Tax=Cryptococcus depauperatus CBS 7841 TaxID=1295531 RepID=A0A1E3IC21_9TREE|nr:hypothetical protein L203_04267 [Cryptococcus depauperatus CBS 7841]
MSTIITIATLLLAATDALAHLQLANPFPFRSPLNPDEQDKDYSMTSPLIASGTYPCKGYITSDAKSTATWAAGSEISYTITGTATHGGGSCQLSMSYDHGATWNVIYSQMGGCPLDSMTNTVTIPADAPSGDALFAWGWFNLQGNREMYHNCAPVTITNGGSGLNKPDYPTPFVANAEVNDCKTIEGVSVVFPDPGKNVRYGGEYASTKPTKPAGFTGSNCVGPGATGGASGSPGTQTSQSSLSTGATSSTVVVSTGVPNDTASKPPAGVNLGAQSTVSAPPPVSTKVCRVKRSRTPQHRSTQPHGKPLVRRVSEDAPKRFAASKAVHSRRSLFKRDGVRRMAASEAGHVLRSTVERAD